MLNKLTTAVLAGFGTLALMLPVVPSPARADSVRTLNCVGAPGSISCVATRRGGRGNPHIIQVPPPISEQETAEQQQRDKIWQARCRPVIRQDDFGVPRYVYAARGCEFGKLD